MWSLSRTLVSLPLEDNKMAVNNAGPAVSLEMFPVHLHISCTLIQFLSGSTLNHPDFIPLFSLCVCQTRTRLYCLDLKSYLFYICPLSKIQVGCRVMKLQIGCCSLAIKLLTNISLCCLNSACRDTRERIKRYQSTRSLLQCPRLMLPRTSLSSCLLLWIYGLDPTPFSLVPLEK